MVNIIGFISIIFSPPISLLLYEITKSSKDTNNLAERTLNYIVNYKIYSIEQKNKNFKIITKNQIVCIKAPCNPQIIGVKSITDNEDIESLKTLFEEIFKNNIEKVKNVFDKDLKDEQIETIYDILENNDIINELTYEIIEVKEENNNLYSAKGYSFSKKRDYVIYTISMGEQPHSGFSISIEKVEIEGNSATIYVKENLPNHRDNIGFDDVLLLYPTAKVKFNRLPSKVKVINQKSEYYKEIKLNK